MTTVTSIALGAMVGWLTLMNPQSADKMESTVRLPAPRLEGEQSLEAVLRQRRSIREYGQEPLSLEEVSQLLWAAQGISRKDGGRTAPSAGALYPLEVYLVAGEVNSLAPGVYHYRPRDHVIDRHSGGDRRAGLARAALGQECVRDGAVVLVISAVYERTTVKYGERGVRYVHMEAGHAAQNLCLQATALGLGAVPVGAFDDAAVQKTLELPAEEKVLYLLPVGRPR